MEIITDERTYEGIPAVPSLVMAAMESSGIRRRIDELCKDMIGAECFLSPGMAVKAMVGAMIERGKRPLYRICDYYSTAPVDKLFGGCVTVKSLSDTTLAQRLDTIFQLDTRKALLDCYRLLQKKYGFRNDRLFMDATNYTMYGTKYLETQLDHDRRLSENGITIKGSPMPTYGGNAKDNHNERVQLNLGHVVDANGIPLMSQSYDGRFYKRVGNTTQMIKREELKDIIADERGTFWMDEPCELTSADVVPTAISSFVVKGQNIGRIPKDIDPEGKDFVLSKYGLVTDDRLTVAGALLFTAKPTHINRGAFLKIGLFDNDGVLMREDIIETPLISLPDETMDTLLEKYIPSTFDYGSVSRSLSNRYPVEGLREIVVNAIVHKNYRIEEPVTVSVHPNRIDVFCYGGLPEGWTIETLVGNHGSMRRNITLATLYHDAGFVENWAQGINKVFRECERNGNPKPEFYQESGGLRVTVTSNVIDVDERIPIPVADTKTKPLSDRQMTIIRMMTSDPRITASSIASELGVTPRTVRNDINALTERGFIRREGNNRSGEWVVMVRIPE